MKCFIYRNLHKEGYTYSIRAMEGPYKGRVVGYGRIVAVKDVTFSVNKASRERVITTGHKNVHAGIVGEVVAVHDLETRLPNDISTQYISVPEDSVDITYNPWIADTFIVRKTRQPINSATTVNINGGLIEATGLNHC